MNSTRILALVALAGIPLLPACYTDLKKRNEDLANANHQLENELNQVRAERDDSRAREMTLQAKASAAEDAARVAREEMAASATNAGASRGSSSGDRASGTARQVQDALASTKASVDTANGRVRVVLPIGESFEPGSAELTSAGKKAVRDIGSRLAKTLPRDARLWIAGHTDADPPQRTKAKYPDNRHLSFSRALEVMSELAAAGFPQKQMVPAAFGEFVPVAAGSSAQDKAKNRRVEIWID